MKTEFFPDASFARLAEMQQFSRSRDHVESFYIVFVECSGPGAGYITFQINESLWDEASKLLDGYLLKISFNRIGFLQ